MTAEEIPERVLAFIAEKIDTVPQLEALLLLAGDVGRAWSAEDVAARIYVQPDAASLLLQALERRGLVQGAGTTATYRYDATWDVSGTRMSEISAVYRKHVVRVATFIHSGSSASVREFARAFDLNKDR